MQCMMHFVYYPLIYFSYLDNIKYLDTSHHSYFDRLCFGVQSTWFVTMSWAGTRTAQSPAGIAAAAGPAGPAPAGPPSCPPAGCWGRQPGCGCAAAAPRARPARCRPAAAPRRRRASPCAARSLVCNGEGVNMDRDTSGHE